MQDSITKIQFKILTPDIEVASEIIQDLANYFRIWELTTQA